MTNIPNLIAKLKEAMNNSTPVNSWYPHLNGKEIRGPYNRWFEVVGPKHPEISSHSGKVLRAEADKDILFFCEAVNSMPEIIQALETQSKVIEKMREALRGTWGSLSQSQIEIDRRLECIEQGKEWRPWKLKECEALEGGNG